MAKITGRPLVFILALILSSLAASSALAQDASSLSYGDAVCDSTVSARSGENLSFWGEAGDSVSIAAFSNDFDAFLELRDPADHVIASDDDSAGGLNSLLSRVELRRSGTYQIRVSSFDHNAQGEYLLILGVNELASGANNSGGSTLDFEGHSALERSLAGADTWRLDAKRGDDLVVALLSANNRRALSDPYLELYRQGQNQPLASNDDEFGSRNAFLRYEIGENGAYLIQATSFSRTEQGDYSLLLGRCR
jgi:hypothetical protein